MNLIVLWCLLPRALGRGLLARGRNKLMARTDRRKVGKSYRILDTSWGGNFYLTKSNILFFESLANYVMLRSVAFENTGFRNKMNILLPSIRGKYNKISIIE